MLVTVRNSSLTTGGPGPEPTTYPSLRPRGEGEGLGALRINPFLDSTSESAKVG